MKRKITRREWAVAIGSSVAAASAQAPRQTTEEVMAEAKAEVRRSIDQMRKFNLPVAAEPAFVFKP